MKKMFLLAIVASLFAACDTSEKVDNSTVKSVDLSRYLGSWYEVAKYDHYFERGIDYAMAKYTLRDDGKIDVLNTGIKDGRAKDAKGIAKLTNTPGLFRVSFFGPFFGDYRIMMLDDNYQYALIGGKNENYLSPFSVLIQILPAKCAVGFLYLFAIWLKQIVEGTIRID